MLTDVGSYTDGDPSQIDLRGALNFINSYVGGAPYLITFSLSSSTITLSTCLPPINLYLATPVIIDGSNSGNLVSINGANAFRGFYVSQANSTSQVRIQNMNLVNCVAQGGNGGTPDGGAGLGAGGGLFVDGFVTGTNTPGQAGVIISNLSFIGCGAQGGSGSPTEASPGQAGGGGGGMGGNGGLGGTISFGFVPPGGGGGGGLMTGSNGGNGGNEVGTPVTGWGAGGGGGGGLFAPGGMGDVAMMTGTTSIAGGGGGGGGGSPNSFGGSAATPNAQDGGSSGVLSGPTTFTIAGGGGGGLSYGNTYDGRSKLRCWGWCWR